MIILITLTSRAARFVKTILGQERPTTAATLAHSLGVSERSIRYDLEAIDLWLKEHGLHLHRKPRVGIWVEGDDHVKAFALAKLSDDGKRWPLVASTQDRHQLILGWILSSLSPVSLQFLQQVMGISQRTLYYDLARLEKWLNDRSLRLVRKGGSLSIIGEEIRLREVLVEFLEWQPATTGLSTVFSNARNGLGSGPSHADPLTGRCVRNLLEQLDSQDALGRINGIVAAAQRAFDIHLEPSLAAALSTHILVILARAKQGRAAETDFNQLERLRQRSEWSIAAWIIRSLEQSFGLDLPPSEVGYVALYLTRSSPNETENADSARRWLLSQEEVALYARTIAEKAGLYLGFDLTKDVELRTGLIAHLFTSLEKIRVGFPVRNPLLSEIRARYPIIHSAARNATREAGAFIGLPVPDEEAGWVALHIGAALERLAQRARRWRGIVACASGVGVAQLMKARLSSEFPGSELTVLGVADEERLWETASKLRVDVVISTLDVRPGIVPVVLVSPFLTARDIQSVADVIHRRASAGEGELLDACRKNRLDEPAGGAPELRGPTLRALLREGLVRVNVEVASADEAIQIAGELLVQHELVTPDYPKAMIDLYHRLGPYIVVAPGVALPHASPADGAKGLGLAVVVLARPVVFGAPEKDPVSVVVTFASSDYTSHLRALIDLFHLLKMNLPKQLTKAGTPQEVIEILSQV